MKQYLDYEGKICVVTGAASGMGRATAQLLVELGAQVYAMDIQEVDVEGIRASIPVDLSDKASVDAAFAKLPEKIDRFFGVAGIMGATLPFMKVARINFIAYKYIAEELLLERLNEGGALAFVTSAAGVNWDKDGNKKYYQAAVNAVGWEETEKAIEATGLTASNGGLAYVYTKMAMNLEIARLQKPYGKRNCRVNALMPGNTATKFGTESGMAVDPSKPDTYAGYAGRMAKPEEMALPLLFLNSSMASYVSGSYIFADFGTSNQIMAEIIPNPVGKSLEDNFRTMA